MIFHVTLDQAEDGGVVAECPALPGCASHASSLSTVFHMYLPCDSPGVSCSSRLLIADELPRAA